MAEDPYAILGVARTAKAEELRAAYRKLAKQHHPDLNPGDKQAEERFKSVSAAYELLSDPEQRARFDRGEINAAGQPQGAPQGPWEQPGRQRYRDFAEGAAGERYHGGFHAGGMGAGADFGADLGDIFGDMFGAAGRAKGPRRGQDQHYALEVGFLDAVNGATRRLNLPDGRTLDVKVPAGLEEGQVLRLRGQGGPGAQGGPPGDALIEVHIAPHAFFRREGADIHLDLPVSLREAVLGAKVNVPTPGGPVALSIPPRSDTGRQLRLRGRGVPARGGQGAGDLYATLRIQLGDADAALAEFLQRWTPETGFDPRHDMMGAA